MASATRANRSSPAHPRVAHRWLDPRRLRHSRQRVPQPRWPYLRAPGAHPAPQVPHPGSSRLRHRPSAPPVAAVRRQSALSSFHCSRPPRQSPPFRSPTAYGQPAPRAPRSSPPSLPADQRRRRGLPDPNRSTARPAHQPRPSALAPGGIRRALRRQPYAPPGPSRQSTLRPHQVPQPAASPRRHSPAAPRLPVLPARPWTLAARRPSVLRWHPGAEPSGRHAAPPPPDPTRPAHRQAPPPHPSPHPRNLAAVELPAHLAQPRGSTPHRESLHAVGPGRGPPSDATLARDRFRRAPPGPAARPAGQPRSSDGPIPLYPCHGRGPVATAPAMTGGPLPQAARPRSGRRAASATPRLGLRLPSRSGLPGRPESEPDRRPPKRPPPHHRQMAPRRS